MKGFVQGPQDLTGLQSLGPPLTYGREVARWGEWVQGQTREL